MRNELEGQWKTTRTPHPATMMSPGVRQESRRSPQRVAILLVHSEKAAFRPHAKVESLSIFHALHFIRQDLVAFHE